ncbi:hypothetical protein F5B19DRAFT_131455 [Rostrohypoxylon terebratum]|nr:hypothetical protein F5B19DRAFT_131455 [Rostrohypoxylon terebratum]
MAIFSDLPPEIRVMIWQFCLPGPRTVMVKVGKHTRAPVVLHICRESRSEAQKHSYELAFPVASFSTERNTLAMNGRPLIWFNFSLDRLCFQDKFFSFPPWCPNLKRVKSIGLMFVQFAYAYPLIYYRLLSRSPQLEEVAVYKTSAEESARNAVTWNEAICQSLNTISQLSCFQPSIGKVWSRSYEEEGRFGDLTRLPGGNCVILLYHRDREIDSPRLPRN